MGILSAILLYILVAIFSPGVERQARFKILGTAIAAALASQDLVHLIPNLVGYMCSIALAVAVVVTLLTLWCGVKRKVALKIAAIYMGALVALSIGVTFLASAA